MRFLHKSRLWLRSLFQRDRVEHELAHEFAFHFDQQVAENLERGMTEPEARAAAHRTIGSIASLQNDCRDTRRMNYLDDLLADLRYATRALRRNRTFTLVSMLTLGVGIGASTAFFSLADVILLQPLPAGDADRMVLVWPDMSAFGIPQGNLSPADFEDWKLRSKSFSGIAAGTVETYNLTGDGEPERIAGLRTTADFLDLFQLRPAAGRLSSTTETNPVVLSHSLWQRRFGGDSSVIGRTIQLDGSSFAVIGVAPKSFEFPTRGTEFWRLRDFTPEERAQRQSRTFFSVARLRPGVSFAQAQTDMSAVAAAMAAEYPEDKGIGATLVSLRDNYAQPAHDAMKLLLGAVVAMLLIVCSNMAHLLLARGTARNREITLRASLGATRTRVVRQLLTESVLLAILGTLAGAMFAALVLPLLSNLIPIRFATGTKPELDLSAFAFAITIALVSAILFGIAPALQASRVNPNEVLKNASGRLTAKENRLRNLIAIGEMALTVVLLASAGLLLQSYARLRFIDTGFEPSHLIALDTALSRGRYDSPASRANFTQQVLARVTSLPGVDSAGYANLAPLTMRGGMAGFVIEGRPAPAPGEIYRVNANIRTVSPGYLRTLRVPLLRGRALDKNDTRASPSVLLINETMARTFWPDEDPLGRRIKFNPRPDEPWHTVVGVVGDIKQMGLDIPSNREMYFALDQTPLRPQLLWPRYLMVRTTAEPSTIMPLLRNAIALVDPTQPVSSIQTMDDVLDQEVASRRTNTTLIAAFALAALFLSAIGLYGVLSYTVARRTPEIGLRMALGAQHTEVIASVMRPALWITTSGLALGLAIAFALRQTLASMLFDVSPADPRTFAAVAVLLFTVALAASYFPARRAASVDPLVALKQD